MEKAPLPTLSPKILADHIKGTKKHSPAKPMDTLMTRRWLQGRENSADTMQWLGKDVSAFGGSAYGGGAGLSHSDSENSLGGLSDAGSGFSLASAADAAAAGEAARLVMVDSEGGPRLDPSVGQMMGDAAESAAAQ